LRALRIDGMHGMHVLHLAAQLQVLGCLRGDHLVTLGDHLVMLVDDRSVLQVLDDSDIFLAAVLSRPPRPP
jgi:hypothetical protein